jgi:hypothetical protein
MVKPLCLVARSGISFFWLWRTPASENKIKLDQIMKTINVLRSLLLMAIFAVAAPSVNASPVVDPVEQKAEVQRLQKRLDEIKAIDKKSLSKEEKKALRGEVKQIKKSMKAISGGVYLSVGAIILIALLIILLA